MFRLITNNLSFIPFLGHLSMLFCGLAFLFSCNNEHGKNGESSADEILKISGEGDFRGVKMGDRLENVRNTEGSEFVYAMPDELVYRIPVSGLDSVWYEISYNFNEQGLYDINLEVYGKTMKSLEILADDFERHYQEKYGDPAEKNSLILWRTMTENGRFVSISVRDSLNRMGVPCLQVNFNESEK